jgi:hypothetical protein
LQSRPVETRGGRRPAFLGRPHALAALGDLDGLVDRSVVVADVGQGALGRRYRETDLWIKPRAGRLDIRVGDGQVSFRGLDVWMLCRGPERFVESERRARFGCRQRG